MSLGIYAMVLQGYGMVERLAVLAEARFGRMSRSSTRKADGRRPGLAGGRQTSGERSPYQSVGRKSFRNFPTLFAGVHTGEIGSTIRAAPSTISSGG